MRHDRFAVDAEIGTHGPYCRRMRPRPSRPFLRVYSYLFVIGLFAITLALVAAASASDKNQGGYAGIAVMWGSGAIAAALLLWAIERRRPGA